MKVIKKIKKMQRVILELCKKGKSIGFVPTMGALHEGHLSLIRRAARENDIVIVSIFVNPTQFSPHEDFHKYPRNLKKDTGLCKKIGVDYVFAPAIEEMYPEGYATYVNVEGYLTETLEGEFRPGHFRGVATIVAKLFNIIQPHRAYFGEKDFQQLLVVKKMVKDLNLPVKIIACPTVREPDGLAMSSRNVFLNSEERKEALVLSSSLKRARHAVLNHGFADAKKLSESIRCAIQASPGIKLDYIAICNARTLIPVRKVKKGCIILVAARAGKTRLIDNIKI